MYDLPTDAGTERRHQSWAQSLVLGGGIERLCFCKFFNIYIYLYINDLLACRGLLDFLHFTLKWAGFPRFT